MIRKFVNGNIYTVEGAGWAEKPVCEMAVDSSGTILCIGNEISNELQIDEVIDLEGKTVLPGFTDAHVHIPGLALTRLFEVNLFGADTKEKVRKRIKDFIEKHPDFDCIFGTGFDMAITDENGDLPSAAWIDDLCGEKEAVFQSYDLHSNIVNSVVLDKLGMSDSSYVYNGKGNVHRNKDGIPTGLLTDTWDIPVPEHIYTEDEICQALKLFEKDMLAWGYTSMMAIAPFSKGLPVEILADFEKCDIKIRTNSSALIRPEAEEKRMSELIEARKRFDRPDLKITTAKYMIDGVIEGQTAALEGDYSNIAGFRGTVIWEYDALVTSFKKAIRNGFQIHCHTIGDAAVSIALKAIGEAQKEENNYELRHVLTHLQLADKEDYRLFGENNIIAAVQTFWHYKEPGFYEKIEIPALGKERCEKMYPLKSLRDNGAIITCSGDYPVSSVNNPLLGIQMGITRNDPDAEDMDKQEYLLNAQERLSLAEMIEAYTANGAYQLFREGKTGTLKEGKDGDFIVLSDDPFTVDAMKLSEIVVEKTFIKGEEVYTRV